MINKNDTNNTNELSYMDISLIKNQNMIAVALANLFSYDEIEDMFSFKDTILHTKREANQPFYSLMDREYENKRTVKLVEIFLFDRTPFVRFVSLRINCNNFYQLDFKFNYCKNLIEYLIFIFGSALNFSKYKSPYDSSYIKNNIYNNYAKILSDSTSLVALNELRSKMQFVNGDTGFWKDETKCYEFEIDSIKYTIRCSQKYILEFKFITNNESYSIYFVRNRIGVSSISLVVQKALKLKQKENKN